MWQTLGVFLLTKEWAFSVPVRGKIFRVKSSYIDNLNNQYLKGVIASVFVENQQTINLVESRRLSYRLEPEIFIFDFPQGLGDQRISLRRLDETNLAWAVTVEVFKGSNMPEINLTISDLSISNVEGLQEALDDKALLEHQHQISEVENLQDALDAKASIVHSHTIDAVDGLQNAFDETISAYSGLFMELNQKAAISHYHDATEIANLTAFVQSMIPRGDSRSEAPPFNPFDGLIWHEITNNVNGDLVESWIYQKGRWQSLTKYSFDYWGPTSNIGGNVSYNLPLDSRYDYLFKEFLVNCMYGTGIVDATTNYWRAIVTTQPTGTTFANSGAIPNDGLSKLFSMNQIFVPAQGERALLMFQKYGNAPGARLGISLRYHLLRK